MKKLAASLVVAILALSAASLRADLLGTKVTGTFNFGASTPNYFDPASGFVPSGFGNSISSVGVTISPGTEFGFADVSNRDTADFTGTGLIVRDLCFTGLSCMGNSSFKMTFTDPAFASVTLLTNTLGVDFSFSGSTLTVLYPGHFVANNDASATFSIGSVAQTPEPGTMGLVATGLLGAASAIRRRFAA